MSVTETPLHIEQPASVFSDAIATDFSFYECEFTFYGLPLLGGLPGDPNALRGWLQRSATKATQHLKGASRDEVRHVIMAKNMLKTAKDLGVDVSDIPEDSDFDEISDLLVERMDEQRVTRFAYKGDQACIPGRIIKAALKEAGAVRFPEQWFSKKDFRPTKKDTTGSAKMIRSLLVEHVWPVEDLVPVLSDSPVRVEQLVKHTPNGSSFAMHEAVDNAVLRFHIKVLGDKINPLIWARLWTYCEENGLWACRSMGYGKFRVTDWRKV